jgi:ankyrin repeat protein
MFQSEQVTRKRSRNEEPIIQASRNGDLASVRNLLRNGADVNAKDELCGMMTLHWACVHDNVEMVKELVSAGADIDAKDKDGVTPLHLASSGGYLECVHEMVSAGADIRAVNNDGHLPVEEAVSEEDTDVVKYLMKALYTSISDHEDRLPIQALLEDASADGTPLREALEEDVLGTDDVLEIIAFLVDQNPRSLSARNQGGELPLHVACVTSANPDIVRFLVDQAPQSIFLPRTADGAYSLHVALERGASSDSEVIKMLLERHDPVTIMLRNNVGETPLHVACRCGVPFAIVQSLVHHYKASALVVTPQGNLPLFLACASAEPSLDIIYLLLKLYPDVLY